MMQPQIKSPDVQIKQAINTVRIMQLTPAKRRRVLRRTGRAVIRDAKNNIRLQRDINGKSFTPRKGKSRKKMLRNLAKPLSEYVMNDRVRVDYFKNRGAGKTAAEHQYGLTQKFTAKKLKRIRRKTDGKKTDPATVAQAKALRAMGYKIARKSGKGEKTPSVKYITENMNRGQAGAIIRKLSPEKVGNTSWPITLPERAFLGMDYNQAQTLLANEIDKIRK